MITKRGFVLRGSCFCEKYRSITPNISMGSNATHQFISSLTFDAKDFTFECCTAPEAFESCEEVQQNEMEISCPGTSVFVAVQTFSGFYIFIDLNINFN